MNELIEKLKDKNYVRAFGLMTDEERDVYKKVGSNNCLEYGGNNWKNAFGGDGRVFDWRFEYVIKPDYRPEPEYEDLEVTKCSNSKGVFYLV